MVKSDTPSLSTEVKRLSIALIGLVSLTILWIAISISYAAVWARHEGWVFPVAEGEPPFNVQAMSFVDYETLVALISLSDVCWLYGLGHLLRMSQRFLRGEVLVAESVSHLIRFGWSLLAAAVLETAIVFMALSFMIYRGYLSSQINPWPYLLNDEGLLTGVGAVLIILIARIFRAAVDLSHEAQLTI